MQWRVLILLVVCFVRSSAVYGDNFFKRSQYTITASLQPSAEAGSDLQATDRKLTEVRGELLAFEKEFKKARSEFEAAVSKLEGFAKDLDELFVEREVKYAKLLDIVPNVGSSPVAGGGMSGASKVMRSAGSQLSGAFRGLWPSKSKGSPSRPKADATGTEVPPELD